VGTEDVLQNMTQVGVGVNGSGYYQNTAEQELGNNAPVYGEESSRGPAYYDNGSLGAGWYMGSDRSSDVGAGNFTPESVVENESEYSGSGPQGSGYYTRAEEYGSYGSVQGAGSYYGSFYSYGPHGSGYYTMENGSVDGSASEVGAGSYYSDYNDADSYGYMELYNGSGPDGWGYYSDVRIIGSGSYYSDGSRGAGVYGSGSGYDDRGSGSYYGNTSNGNGGSGYLSGGDYGYNYWYA